MDLELRAANQVLWQVVYMLTARLLTTALSKTQCIPTVRLLWSTAFHKPFNSTPKKEILPSTMTLTLMIPCESKSNYRHYHNITYLHINQPNPSLFQIISTVPKIPETYVETMLHFLCNI